MNRRAKRKTSHHKNLTKIKTHGKKVWKGVIPNFHGLSYAPGPNTRRSGKMSDPLLENRRKQTELPTEFFLSVIFTDIYNSVSNFFGLY